MINLSYIVDKELEAVLVWNPYKSTQEVCLDINACKAFIDNPQEVETLDNFGLPVLGFPVATQPDSNGEYYRVVCSEDGTKWSGLMVNQPFIADIFVDTDKETLLAVLKEALSTL